MPAYIPLGLKNNGLFPRLSGLWCPRPMITLSICPWTTKAVCKQARPPAWRGLLHLPASVCRYGEVQTELSSELCSDKQGRASLGAQAITEKAAHCCPANRLPFAPCFLWAWGQCYSGRIIL